MLSREEGGQFIRKIWVQGVYDFIEDPKHSYVAPWEEMAEWEKEIDRRIWEQVAAAVRQQMEQEQAASKE